LALGHNEPLRRAFARSRLSFGVRQQQLTRHDRRGDDSIRRWERSWLLVRVDAPVYPVAALTLRWLRRVGATAHTVRAQTAYQ